MAVGLGASKAKGIAYTPVWKTIEDLVKNGNYVLKGLNEAVKDSYIIIFTYI